MSGHLKKLGYPDCLVADAILRAKSREQSQLRRDKSLDNPIDNEKLTLPFVHTFNPRDPSIYSRVLDCLKILDESRKMKHIMQDTNVVPSLRQPPSLKLLLVKSYFSLQDQVHEVKGCRDEKCALCKNKQIIEGSSVKMENGFTFNIKESMTCKTKNVVYALFCQGCTRTYIGETGQMLCTRASEHRTHIMVQDYWKLEVSLHVWECAGHLSVPFLIMPIFKMNLNCSRIEREGKEFFLQKFLAPSLHPGPRLQPTVPDLS